MDDREQQRKVRHRLAVLRHAEEVTGNVSATCRYYGISRQVFYKWRRRFEDERRGRPAGPVIGAAALAERDQGRGRRQDHLPAPALPLRAAEDLDVPQALPRRRDRPLGRVSDPQAPRAEPVAGVAALQAPHRPVEALREAAARPPRPGRREVHRTASWNPQEALPIHRDRRLHPHPGAADLPAQRPEDRDPVPRLRPREAPVPGRGRSRPTTAPSSKAPSTGTSSTAASATSTSSPPRLASTARSSDHTASTPRSSTECSTAS